MSDNEATELRTLTTQEVKTYQGKKSKVLKDYLTLKSFLKSKYVSIKKRIQKTEDADITKSCLKLSKKSLSQNFLIPENFAEHKISHNLLLRGYFKVVTSCHR